MYLEQKTIDLMVGLYEYSENQGKNFILDES